MTKKTPLVSFCMATYKRPEWLRKTLDSILSQEYDKIEVIVSDNDDERSGRKVCDSYKDVRIQYVKNPGNKDMVSNFNHALSLAKGEYICMIADDDPVDVNLLSTLLPLTKKYPEYGMFHAASRVNVVNASMSASTRNKSGQNILLNPKHRKGSIYKYSSKIFVSEFMKRNIFPYMLWSTGIIKRNMMAVGMPDFGTSFFTDYAYLLINGSNMGCVTVNIDLGEQTIHEENSNQDLKSAHKIAFNADNIVEFLVKHTKHAHRKEITHFFIEILLTHFINLRRITGVNSRYDEWLKIVTLLEEKLLLTKLQKFWIKKTLLKNTIWEYVYFMYNGTIYRYIMRKIGRVINLW